MPRGPVWADDAASVQGKVLAALATSLWRNDAAAVQLLVDTFPATADAMLPEWELTLGLLGEGTIPQRRSRIVARLVGGGGQSRARFIAFAASLGFTITIGNYAPLRAGRFVAGDAAFDTAWIDAWSIHIVANTSGLQPAALKVELDAIRPAETTTLLV